MDHTVGAISEPSKRDGWPFHVLEQALQFASISLRDAAACIDVETRMLPFSKERDALLSDRFFLEQHLKSQLLKDFFKLLEIDLVGRVE